MKEQGASKSVMGGSTVRSGSVMSQSLFSERSASVRSGSVCSSVDWETPNVKASGQKSKLQTHRGRTKLPHNVNKPLVPRPSVNKSKQCLPAPSPSAFRQPTHVSMNQIDYKELAPLKPSQNQGPTRAPNRKKESTKHFSKACEQQVRTSALSGSKVFSSRNAVR